MLILLTNFTAWQIIHASCVIESFTKYFEALKFELLKVLKAKILNVSCGYINIFCMNNSLLDVADGVNKKISRVESLKNLILHGKIEPDLPPDVFNYPFCSCRYDLIGLSSHPSALGMHLIDLID